MTDEVGHVIDIMATVLDTTGVSYPIEYKGNSILPQEGRSLVPTFQGRLLGERELYWDYANRAAVRLGKWKLLAPSTKKIKWELYDMESDRGELNNLAARHPEKVQEMAAMYETWLKHIGPDRNKRKQYKVGPLG